MKKNLLICLGLALVLTSSVSVKKANAVEWYEDDYDHIPDRIVEVSSEDWRLCINSDLGKEDLYSDITNGEIFPLFKVGHRFTCEELNYELAPIFYLFSKSFSFIQSDIEQPAPIEEIEIPVEEPVESNEEIEETIAEEEAPVHSDFEYVDLGNGQAKITSYIGEEVGIVIPSTIDNLVVTQIGEMAFYGLSLTSVELPAEISIIGEQAFAVNNLTEIVLPVGIQEIGYQAFSNNRIENLDLSESNAIIGAMAFHRNVISNVQLPKNETKFGTAVFQFNAINSIEIPTTWTMIPHSLFRQNSITSLDIPSNIQEIGAQSFDRNALTNLVIPENVKKVNHKAFANNDLTFVRVESADVLYNDDDIEIGGYGDATDIFDYQKHYAGSGDQYDVLTICSYNPSTSKEYAAKYTYSFEDCYPVKKEEVVPVLEKDDFVVLPPKSGDGSVESQDKLTKQEKIAIATVVVLTIVLLSFVSKNKDAKTGEKK